MGRTRAEIAAMAILYIETHLSERIDLEAVAEAAHYSKYHLHHMFTAETGMTLHDYIRRRRLTRAAELLVFSEKPVLDVSLAAGYESQQAFTSIFKAMYKQTPAEYRMGKKFYPLQLKLTLTPSPPAPGQMVPRVTTAREENVADWMKLVLLVVRDFPCFQEKEHLENLKKHIRRHEAFLMWDGELAVGAAAFSRETGAIHFLGVHPQYRNQGVTEAFLNHLSGDGQLSITTFRDGDRADTGQRREYLNLGFLEAELLTEYGYPTQRLILPPGHKALKGGTGV